MSRLSRSAILLSPTPAPGHGPGHDPGHAPGHKRGNKGGSGASGSASVGEHKIGGRITDVAPLPSNPYIERIKVDGRLVARLSSSDVEALNLEVGRKWTAALATRVHEAMERAKAHKLALTMLGRRAWSEGELIDRLLKRGHSPAVAQSVANDLREHHWLDDESYATALAEELASRKGASHTLIIERLRARRIEESLAHSVANRVLGETGPLEAATALVQKRLAAMRGIDPPRAARRIAGFLERRGYDEQTIADALARVGLADS